MKDYLKLFLMVVVTVFTLEFINFSKVDAQGGNEEFHLKTFEALKRINTRLVRMETDKMRSLKSVQESLLNQIMSIRTSLEQIQAVGEMSKTEILASAEGVKTKVLDVESHVKNEVMQALDKQNQEGKRYRVEIITQINAQNDRLADTNLIFKSELIPAIQQELKKNNSRFDKLAKDMMSKSDLSNDKLSRLVDILKSFAIEQSKIDQVQKTILTNQKKIMETLQGLRRKANINISRSDDLLKKIKK